MKSDNVKKMLILSLLVVILPACLQSTPDGEVEPALTSLSATLPSAAATNTLTPEPIITTSTPTSTQNPPTETSVPEPEGYIARIIDDQLNLMKLNDTDSMILALDTKDPESYRPYCYPGPAFSPDGRFLAVTRTTNTVPMGGRDLVVIDMLYMDISTIITDVGLSFSWFPDSTQIISTSPLAWDSTGTATDDGLWVVNVFTGQKQQLIPPFPDFPVGTLDISPDGRHLGLHKAYFEGFGPFRIINMDGSGYQDWDGVVGAFDWSPDGQQIVYDENNYVTVPPSRGYIAHVDGSQKVVIVDRQYIAAVRPQWSPDGTMIAFINDLDLLAKPSQLWILRLDGGQLEQLDLPDIAVPSGGAYWSIQSWTPDSTRLIVTGMDGRYLISLDGSPPAYLFGNGCVAIQPGSWILNELPTPVPVTPSPILNFSDPESIVAALAHDLAHGTDDAFSQVIQMDTIFYGTGLAGSRYEVDRATFLAELGERISNRPGCAGYTINANQITISLFTTDWQPLWQEPGGATSDEINFIFHLYPAGISVDAYFFPSSDILDVVDHQPCPSFE
jgi:hypothetical protein